MKINWFKDGDGSLWFHDFEDSVIYSIFNTGLKDKLYCVGVYRRVRLIKNRLINEKPLFYDGFKLSEAKKLVMNMVGVKDEKKVKSVRRIKRNSK